MPAQRPPNWQGDHRIVLLQGGRALFPAMVAAIDAAQRSVWLASYIYRDDDDTRQVTAALVRAAARGVDVRVVVDGFGTSANLPLLRAAFDAAGVRLTVFRPIERWWNWLQPGQLRRLHHKLCVCDGTVAFVGGINLISDHFDLIHGATQEPRLDFAVQVRGPVAAEVEQTTRAVWTRASLGRKWPQEVSSVARSAHPVRRARRLLDRLQIARPDDAAAVDRIAPQRAAFVVRDNLRRRRDIERAYIAAIDSATRRVDIVCPYFYPGGSFRRALLRAAGRGVRVRLLLQGRPDYRVAAFAARLLYVEFIAAGIEVHEYTAAFLHAKVALVDNRWATVGSSNIDPISLVLNLEANVLVDDDAFAATLRTALEAALQQSTHITEGPWRHGALAWLGRAAIQALVRIYLRAAGAVTFR